MSRSWSNLNSWQLLEKGNIRFSFPIVFFACLVFFLFLLFFRIGKETRMKLRFLIMYLSWGDFELYDIGN